MSPWLATNFGELHRQIGHFGQTRFNLIDATKFVTLTDKLDLEHYTLQYRQCRERALQRSGRKSQHLLCPVTLLMTLSYLPAQITIRNTLWATTQIISSGEKLFFCTSHMSLMMVVTTLTSDIPTDIAQWQQKGICVSLYLCIRVDASVCVGLKQRQEWTVPGFIRATVVGVSWVGIVVLRITQSRNSSTEDHSE